MSTRCTVHFQSDGVTQAIVYRHSDGYPKGPHGVKAALKQFFADIKKQTKDTRFNDPCYLAAKFVVWQAEKNEGNYQKLANGEYGRVSTGRLNFLGVGVVMEDPGDIAYRYIVKCTSGFADQSVPTVEVEEA